MIPATREKAREAKRSVRQAFQETDSVVGVGIVSLGDGYAVEVALADTTEPGDDLIASMGGVAVLYRVVGQVRAG